MTEEEIAEGKARMTRIVAEINALSADERTKRYGAVADAFGQVMLIGVRPAVLSLAKSNAALIASALGWSAAETDLEAAKLAAEISGRLKDTMTLLAKNLLDVASNVQDATIDAVLKLVIARHNACLSGNGQLVLVGLMDDLQKGRWREHMKPAEGTISKADPHVVNAAGYVPGCFCTPCMHAMAAEVGLQPGTRK